MGKGLQSLRGAGQIPGSPEWEECVQSGVVDKFKSTGHPHRGGGTRSSPWLPFRGPGVLKATAEDCRVWDETGWTSSFLRVPPTDPQVHVGVRNCHCRVLFTQATVTPDIRVVSAPTLGTASQRRPGSAVILLPHLRSLANPRALEPLPESPATLKPGFCPSWEPAPSLTGGIWGDAAVVTGASPRPLGQQRCSGLQEGPPPAPAEFQPARRLPTEPSAGRRHFPPALSATVAPAGSRALPT